MRPVTFLDTSVLCELVEVPGKCQHKDEVRAEYARRVASGERFVLPVTAVIETGNHIAQARENRRSAAERLVGMLLAAVRDEAPFVLNEVHWDGSFTEEFCAGNSTQQSFIDLAGNGLMGVGMSRCWSSATASWNGRRCGGPTSGSGRSSWPWGRTRECPALVPEDPPPGGGTGQRRRPGADTRGGGGPARPPGGRGGEARRGQRRAVARGQPRRVFAAIRSWVR